MSRRYPRWTTLTDEQRALVDPAFARTQAALLPTGIRQFHTCQVTLPNDTTGKASTTALFSTMARRWSSGFVIGWNGAGKWRSSW